MPPTTRVVALTIFAGVALVAYAAPAPAAPPPAPVIGHTGLITGSTGEILLPSRLI
jgi:hypothetical protein